MLGFSDGGVCFVFFVFVIAALFFSHDFVRTLKHEIVIVYVEVARHGSKRRRPHQAYIPLQVGGTDLVARRVTLNNCL